MSRKRTDAQRASEGEVAVEAESKDELRRQMEEARAAVSETVGEIKSVVARQYEEVRERVESVREGFEEVLDWREQFERNPIVWGAGAVSVGILIGLGLARALDDEDPHRGDSLAGQAASELTSLADAVLPTISAKVKELFGLDLDAYLRETHRPRARALASPRQSKKRSAKQTAKRSTKKSVKPATTKTARKSTKQTPAQASERRGAESRAAGKRAAAEKRRPQGVGAGRRPK